MELQRGQQHEGGGGGASQLPPDGALHQGQAAHRGQALQVSRHREGLVSTGPPSHQHQGFLGHNNSALQDRAC